MIIVWEFTTGLYQLYRHTADCPSGYVAAQSPDIEAIFAACRLLNQTPDTENQK